MSNNLRGHLLFMHMMEAINQFCEWRQFKVTQSTVRNYRSSLAMLYIHLQDNPKVEEVTLYQVLDYLQKLVDMGYDNNAIIPKAIALRKFFEFLRLQGMDVIHHELIPVPRTRKKLPRVANPADVQVVIRAISQKKLNHCRDKALFSMLADSGARVGEVLALNVADLDLTKRQALIRTEKNRGSRPFRKIFWSETTNVYIQDWLKRRKAAIRVGAEYVEGDPVFFAIRSHEHIRRIKRMRPSGVCYVFNIHCQRAGVPYFNPHSLRHSLAREIIKKGGSNSDVSNILGHTNLNSSFIYTMMDGKELEERYEKFFG